MHETLDLPIRPTTYEYKTQVRDTTRTFQPNLVLRCELLRALGSQINASNAINYLNLLKTNLKAKGRQ